MKICCSMRKNIAISGNGCEKNRKSFNNIDMVGLIIALFVITVFLTTHFIRLCVFDINKSYVSITQHVSSDMNKAIILLLKYPHVWKCLYSLKKKKERRDCHLRMLLVTSFSEHILLDFCLNL